MCSRAVATGLSYTSWLWLYRYKLILVYGSGDGRLSCILMPEFLCSGDAWWTFETRSPPACSRQIAHWLGILTWVRHKTKVKPFFASVKMRWPCCVVPGHFLEAEKTVMWSHLWAEQRAVHENESRMLHLLDFIEALLPLGTESSAFTKIAIFFYWRLLAKNKIVCTGQSWKVIYQENWCF